MSAKTNCDYCINYIYDEETGCYECAVSLDEDEMDRFLSHSFRECPYFQFDNEYKMVQKQN